MNEEYLEHLRSEFKEMQKQGYFEKSSAFDSDREIPKQPSEKQYDLEEIIEMVITGLIKKDE